MAKTRACRVGRHQWAHLFQQGQAFTVCLACGNETKPKGDKTKWEGADSETTPLTGPILMMPLSLAVPEPAPTWLLACGHEIPLLEHRRRHKPPRRCPVCGAVQHVKVRLGGSGDDVYECQRCNFTTSSDDEINQHDCRPRSRLPRLGRMLR